jgi:hypothetical protein
MAWSFFTQCDKSFENVEISGIHADFPFANSRNIEFANTYSTVIGDPKWRSIFN